jgi:hypothetical protein
MLEHHQLINTLTYIVKTLFLCSLDHFEVTLLLFSVDQLIKTIKWLSRIHRFLTEHIQKK